MHVFDSPCKNCLFSKDRIVSPQRMKNIVQGCIDEGKHFICHVSSMDDTPGEGNTMCHGFHEKMVDRIPGLALLKRMGLIFKRPQPPSSKLMPWREMGRETRVAKRKALVGNGVETPTQRRLRMSTSER